MSAPVKNVAVIGASGNLGPSILHGLLDAGIYNVTAISRTESKATFPTNVKVIKTEYTPEALTTALKGIDALIVTVGSPALGDQKLYIDAAIAAGVKRVLPSDFGSDVTHPKALEIVPFFAGKTEVIDYLKTKESKISWSSVITGGFFDWGLKVGFLGFDIPNKKATLWDNGEAKFGTTNLSTIGLAISRILSPENYEATKNAEIFITSRTVSQAEILPIFEKETGAKWTIENKDSQGVIGDVLPRLKGGEVGPQTIYPLIQAFSFGKGLGGDYSAKAEKWNELLKLPNEDLEEDIKAVLAGKKPEH